MEPTPADVSALLDAFNSGRMAEAEERAATMTHAHPGTGLGWRALGTILVRQGRALEALVPAQRSAEFFPNDAEAQNTLGAVLQSLGRFSEAETSFRRAIVLKPGYAEAHNNLGAALMKQGRRAEAEIGFRAAIALSPIYAEAHANLGAVLADTERPAEAEIAFRRALELRPVYADAYNKLTVLLQGEGRLTEAEANARQAVSLCPKIAKVHNNLGSALLSLGKLSEAEASFRRAIDIDPNHARAYQNLIFVSDLTSRDAASHQAERKHWAERFAPDTGNYPPFLNSPDPDRRLRIGYVSSDFRKHAAATAFGAMLVDFDGDQIEVFAYSGVVKPDEVTARFRRSVTQWREIANESDAGVAALIRKDRIDVLVDLSGHSAGDRLAVFARRPAPVQVTAWGYLTGTGMKAMDAIFADPVVIPEDEKRFYTEEVRYLPSACSAFFALDLPDVGALPASTNDEIVFGSFNRLCKISEEALELWARVLRAVPGSKFLIKTTEMSDPPVRKSVLKRFADVGVEAQRLVFMGKSSRYDHMSAFNKIDIALDSFPQGGGLTALEGLMMGVPVIARRWPTIPGRMSATFLKTLGMDDWIAASDDEYVEIAVRKARDRKALAELRQALRARIRSSILGDTKSYAAAVEREYRALWKAWCERQTARQGNEVRAPEHAMAP